MLIGEGIDYPRQNLRGITTMTTSNHISASINEEDLSAILDALKTLKEKSPFMITLTSQERKELAKLGEKSMGFEAKCEAYMNSHPEFMPGYIQAEELQRDRLLRSQISQFLPLLHAYVAAIEDTLMAAKSDVYLSDLAYYHSVRDATHRGIPGAEAIYNDLSSRFPGSRRKTPGTPSSEDPQD